MPEVASLVHLRSNPIISISVTNNDAADYTSAPIFTDIPSSYIQTLGCDWSQMRLEDENGNPVTFWPDANGANEVYPGYYSIWFKIDLPASGTRTLRLYCDQSNPTYTDNPTDVVDYYCDCSDLSQLYSKSDTATVDTEKYLDPPASINIYPAETASTTSDGYVYIDFNYSQKLIIKENLNLVRPGCGYDLVFTVYTGSGIYYSGPMIWYGDTNQYYYGTNLGYRTSTTTEILGQYDADGKWHRYLVLVDGLRKTFEFLYDDKVLGTNLPFYSDTPDWDPSYTYYFRVIAYSYSSYEDTPNLSDPHIDSVVVTSVPYSSLPTINVIPASRPVTDCLSKSPDLT